MSDQLVGYVLRHGDTDLNQENSFRSWIDVPLNADGLAQAKNAARWLKDKPLQNVISSPLLRAFVTASIAARTHGLTVYQHRGLFPWRLGCFSGQSKTDHQDALRLFVRSPQVVIPGGGESLQAFEDRQFAFWEESLKRARDKAPVLFVAHTSNIVALESFTQPKAGMEPEDSDTVKPGGIAAIYWNGRNHRVEPVFGQVEEAIFGGS